MTAYPSNGMSEMFIYLYQKDGVNRTVMSLFTSHPKQGHLGEGRAVFPLSNWSKVELGLFVKP